MKQTNQIKLYFQYNSNRFKDPQILLTDYSSGLTSVLSCEDKIFEIENLLPGTHKFGLQLINKTEKDTIVNDFGEIVEDLWVKITKIEIDDVDVTDKIDVYSVYHDNQGNPVKTYGFIGFVSEYKLFLQTPGFYFVRNLSNIQATEFESWYNYFHGSC